MESLFVDGPVAYSCWVYRDPNRDDLATIIHNFGDIHRLYSGCSYTMAPKISIEELISETIAVANERGTVVDLFFETEQSDCYNSVTYSKYAMQLKGAMNRIAAKFSSCFCLTNALKKQECRENFPAGRFHAVDLRRVLGFSTPSKDWPEMEDKQSAHWIGFKTFVKNQIYRVENGNVRGKLLEMYQTIRGNFELKKDTVDSYNSIMDIYLLGRLFRSYDNIGGNLKSAFNNAAVKNAILYTGMRHKLQYDEFFKAIGALCVYEFQPIPQQLLHPRMLPFPQCVGVPVFKINNRRYYLPLYEDFTHTNYQEFKPRNIDATYAIKIEDIPVHSMTLPREFTRTMIPKKKYTMTTKRKREFDKGDGEKKKQRI
jgi:hypothetical protein